MTDITIKLYMSELLHDFRSKVHYIGRSRATDSEVNALIQDANDEAKVDVILRSFNNALASLVSVLSEYCQCKVTSASDALIDGTKDISLTIGMPSNFNLSMTTNIAQGAHKYLVDCALNDWCKQTVTSDVQIYTADMQEDITNLRYMTSRRVRPERTDITTDQVSSTYLITE